MIEDKKRIDRYIKSVASDFKGIKFEESDTEITFRIGNVFMKRPIDGDYDYAVKKLWEDFVTHITTYYINHFWEL